MLLAGVGIGWWMVGLHQAKKIVPAVNSRIEKETGPLPTAPVTFDVNGRVVPAVDVSGIVQKWDPGTGEVEFLRNNKLLTLTVDPAQTVIFIPSLLAKDRVLKVTTKTGLRWQTAFCQGDFIDFHLSGDRVAMAASSGYRLCGFKDE